jgi:ketosteroid isomerase-like protein
MRDMRSRFLAVFVGALLLACAQPAAAASQEKDKEPQKPASGTVEAWRQALPPEAEATEPAEGETAAAPPRVSREEVEAGLRALELKWMEALRLRDASALSQIIADDFALVSPQLVVAAGDKEKYFKHAMRELNLASYDFEELSVRLYGRTAVVSARLKQSANAAGEDWGGSYLVTDVWVSRDGFWQVVSRHATLIPVRK